MDELSISDSGVASEISRLAAQEPNAPFGRYRILRTIAFGGMAQILLAEDTRNNRRVVIKRILPQFAVQPEFVKFFIHEGRLGQRLHHPQLVETIEAGRVGGTPYIALEHLEGTTAIDLLRRIARRQKRLPLGAAVRIVADAARGLHYAHNAKDGEGNPLCIVHRDVTPHNLFVCRDGITKVLDFGIAKAASQLHHTRTGTVKGKFSYLAPEQIRCEEIDHRVDVFALGIVLYEFLTMRPLFRGNNDAETLQRVLTFEVPGPETIWPGTPAGLAAVAMRALKRDTDRRLPSAETLADSIEAVAAAEGIDASHAAVAKLLAEFCPPEAEPEENTKANSLFDSGAQPAVDAPSGPQGHAKPSRGKQLALVGGGVVLAASGWLAMNLLSPPATVPTPASIATATAPAAAPAPALVDPQAPATQADAEPKRAAAEAPRVVRKGRGRLRIAATPWAEVVIDGRAIGVTPLVPTELTEGTHTIVFKNPDLHAVVRRQVTITTGKETVVKVDLFKR